MSNLLRVCLSVQTPRVRFVLVSLLSLTCQGCTCELLPQDANVCPQIRNKTNKKKKAIWIPACILLLAIFHPHRGVFIPKKKKQNKTPLQIFSVSSYLIFCQRILQKNLPILKPITNLWRMLSCVARMVNTSACFRMCVLSGERVAHLPVCYRVQPATGKPGQESSFFINFWRNLTSSDVWIWVRRSDVQNLTGNTFT